ncbi:MAG: SDR family oxidoreductase [Nannocystaceae bacterium]
MMDSRSVVVSGDSSGIGLAVRERLLACGCTVIGLSRRGGNSDHSSYHRVRLDLSKIEAIEPALRRVVATHGDVAALVSNAGQPAFGHLEQHSATQIRAAIEINLVSHMVVTRALLPTLKRNAPADVVLMGSEAALEGGKRGTLYCAAKFGLRGFALALRQECASSGVRVTAVHPGMVRTAFFDDLDFGPGDEPEQAMEADDVAEVVLGVLSARRGTVIEEVVMRPMTKVVRTRQGL